ncbi:hypothetical protein DMO16_13115 [Fictibacillus sp. S7]|nr:hypothetical protein DMO16_13115 [Fictibacillus sp. S7]
MRDSCGTSVTGETPAGACAKRLTARPAESERPETEINGFQTCWIAPFLCRDIFNHLFDSTQMVG